MMHCAGQMPAQSMKISVLQMVGTSIRSGFPFEDGANQNVLDQNSAVFSSYHSVSAMREAICDLVIYHGLV